MEESFTLYYLVKLFSKQRHAEEFLRGKLHVNRLSYFRKIEDIGRRDENEGAYLLQPEQTADFRIWNSDSPSETVDLVPDLISAQIHLDAVDDLNVFCMHAGNLDETRLRDASNGTAIQLPSLPETWRAWGHYAVLVTGVAEFVERVRAAARRENYRSWRSVVRYYNAKTFHTPFPLGDVRGAFHKRDTFADEREFRFVFDTGTPGTDAITLNIGDICDIARPIDPAELGKVRFRILPSLDPGVV